MTDPISKELFSHLVQLAALELDQEESEYLRMQLNHQLQAIEELQTIPLDPSIPPAAHGIPFSPDMSPPIRNDEWHPEPDPACILAQAPELEDGYIVVPEIPHTDL